MYIDAMGCLLPDRSVASRSCFLRLIDIYVHHLTCSCILFSPLPRQYSYLLITATLQNHPPFTMSKPNYQAEIDHSQEVAFHDEESKGINIDDNGSLELEAPTDSASKTSRFCGSKAVIKGCCGILLFVAAVGVGSSVGARNASTIQSAKNRASRSSSSKASKGPTAKSTKSPKSYKCNWGACCDGYRRVLTLVEEENKEDGPSDHRRLTTELDAGVMTKVYSENPDRIKWIMDHVDAQMERIDSGEASLWDEFIDEYYERVKAKDLTIECINSGESLTCSSSSNTQCGRDLIKGLDEKHQEYLEAIQQGDESPVFSKRSVPESCL
jgi:hypothetical protein